MTDLVIDRLHVRAAVTDPDDAGRVSALLADLTGRRLAEDLDGVWLPPGDWCLRRLDVSLGLDDRDGDVALGRAWARAVTDALVGALAAGGPDVVHFPRRTDAVADLVSGLALGAADRQWAWRAAGVLKDGDPDPVHAPARAALAGLARDPASVVPALTAAVRRAGLPALHRLLGTRGWIEVASLAIVAMGQAPGKWLEPKPSPAARGGPSGSIAGDPAGDPAAGPIVTGILARSTLVSAWRDSRLRPDPRTARAWAVLAAAEAEPALLRRPVAEAVLALLPGAVDPALAVPAGPGRAVRVTHDEPVNRDPGHADSGPVDGGPTDTRATPDAADTVSPRPVPRRPVASQAPPRRPVSAQPDRPATSPAHPPRPPGAASSPVDKQPFDRPATSPARPGTDSPVAPAAAAALATAWGGLAYLLATAADAGLPDVAFADPELAAMPGPWILFQLGRLLAAPTDDGTPDDDLADDDPADDPAVRALAGLPPSGPRPRPEPTPAQRVQLELYADRWARVTTGRLGDTDRAASRAVVRRLAARAGTVDAVAGWIEIGLRLADVNLAVRRAGLDIDPGFVAWLGAVVVIRYG